MGQSQAVVGKVSQRLPLTQPRGQARLPKGVFNLNAETLQWLRPEKGSLGTACADAFRKLHLLSFLQAEGVEARKGRAKCEMLHIAVCWTWVPVLALWWQASWLLFAKAQLLHL